MPDNQTNPSNYNESPIATSPAHDAHFECIMRSQQYQGQLVAVFSQPAAEKMNELSFHTFFGKKGLASNEENNPEADLALKMLKNTEDAARKDSEILNSIPFIWQECQSQVISQNENTHLPTKMAGLEQQHRKT